ncbi:24268_t:CDS:1, partial [Racocetra persica]
LAVKEAEINQLTQEIAAKNETIPISMRNKPQFFIQPIPLNTRN